MISPKHQGKFELEVTLHEFERGLYSPQQRPRHPRTVQDCLSLDTRSSFQLLLRESFPVLKIYKFRAIMRHLIERKQERECAFEPVTPFVFAEIPMLQLVLLLELQLLVEPWQISDQYPACAK